MEGIEKDDTSYSNDENNSKSHERRSPGELWNGLVSIGYAFFHSYFFIVWIGRRDHHLSNILS